MLFHVIAWVYRFDKGLGMDLGDSFLPKIALFIALLSIYEALMLIHSRAHVEFLCQYIRCVCVFPFLSLWLHIHVCKECCVKLPFCRFFSLLLCLSYIWPGSTFKIPCRQKTIEVISTHFLAWTGSGTLMKPKYHFRVVGGLLVRGLEPEKDLKAEKGWFLGQNQVFHFGHYFLLVKDRENPSTPPCRGIRTQNFKPLFTSESGHQGAR